MIRLLLALALAAPVAAAPGQQQLIEAVGAAGLPPSGLLLLDDGGTKIVVTPGFEADAPLPVASASKWIAAALILTVVDEGRLRLDTRVGEVLPDPPPAWRDVTLAQLLAHTAGAPPTAALRDRTSTSLSQSADAVLALTPDWPPGARFAYGGSGMQIAARMAEVASGFGWDDLWQARLAGPLGITTARWGHPLRADAGFPQVAGGLRISLIDYGRFLALIRDQGRANGRQLLTASSISAIERDWLGSAIIAGRPPAVTPEWRYGLGVWCERVAADGSCPSVSSPGALGAYPWIDRTLDQAGIFLTRAPLSQALPVARSLRAASTRPGRQ